MTNQTNHEGFAPFWEHVDELRSTILKVLAIIGIGVLFCFVGYSQIISFLTAPIGNPSTSSPLFETKERLEYYRIRNHKNQNITYQLPELQSKFPPEIVEASPGTTLLKPGTYQIPPGEMLIYRKPHDSTRQLVLLGPLEGIMVALKTSLWLGVVSTSPFWLFVLLQFVSPALRDDERRLIFPFLAVSLGFIGAGAFFAYAITIPLANEYLIAFNESIGVNLWSLVHYLDYTLFLLLANSLAFESGAIGLFAVHLGIVSKEGLIANRRLAIVLAFIMSAVLTPPDIFTQFMLAIPLIALYEGVICFARIQEKRRGVGCKSQGV